MAPKKKTPARKRAPKLELASSVVELKLDLGSGQSPREGYEGVDLHAPNAKHRVHLWNGESWPWADSTVDALHASHVIEHIDALYLNILDDKGVHVRQVDALMFFFSEAWRVAKPGAKFTLIWPALQNVRAFQDPTHRRFIPMQLMGYLDKNCREMNKIDHYLGGCDWVMESCAPTTTPDNALKHKDVQLAKFVEDWGFSEDFHATLVCRKA